MWNTPNGKRVLVGSERYVFGNAIDFMIDQDSKLDFEQLDASEEWLAGPFRALSIPDKYLVLRAISRALFSPDVPIPFQSALYESAIFSVFEYWVHNNTSLYVGSEIELATDIDDVIDYFMEGNHADSLFERDFGAAPPTRDAVVAALFTQLQTPNGARDLAETFKNKVLFDEDFLYDPSAATNPMMMNFMGISPKYWSEGPVQLAALRKEAKEEGASFSIIYWDLKASYLTTGFTERWASIRAAAVELERAEADKAKTKPSTKEQLREFARSNHLDTLPDKASFRAALAVHHPAETATVGTEEDEAVVPTKRSRQVED